MKQLYILRPRPGVAWPKYDAAFGFVVRAEGEHQARVIAQNAGSDELAVHPDAWLSEALTTCEQLHHPGDVGVVMRDFNAA